MTSYEATGKSLDEAIRAGLSAMGVERDAVSVEVLEKPKSGFFGFGGTPARVRLTLAETESAKDILKAAKPVERPRTSAPAPQRAKQQPQPPRAKQEPVKNETPAVSPPPVPVRPPVKNTQEPRRTRPAAEIKSRQSRPPHPATPEQEKAAREFIDGLMIQMKANVKVTSDIDGDGVIRVNLEGDNMGSLIGRRGDTLDAIQHLTGHVINHDPERMCRVHVDASNYRAKRQDALERLARRMAENTVKYRSNMVLEPMNAYERHIIHMTLQNMAGISTYSQGVEPQRRVVIAYQGQGGRPAGRPAAQGSRPARSDGGRHGNRPGGRFGKHDSRDVGRGPRGPQRQSRPEAPRQEPTAAPPVSRSLPVKEFGVKRSKDE